MSIDCCTSIRETCTYWPDAPILRHKVEALDPSTDGNDFEEGGRDGVLV